MPYTPPSHRSPASSASNSPDVSRRPSFHSGPRPSLPRSASYLNKHRRTPSVSAIPDMVPQSSVLDHYEEMKPEMLHMKASIRQSPPPPLDTRELMPRGAIISPPESATSGSDEDEPPEIKSRRTVVPKDLENLKEAVSQITKASTPPPPHTQAKEILLPSLRVSFSTSSLSELPMSAARKNGHVRSVTEPHASILKKSSSSLTASEEEADEDLKYKPQMVRKKSGELVRPALRGHRRPSSVPGTPVFSKAVHFDSHLEHVRHFLQVDRPLAVSAGSSPAENYESDAEYPFPTDSRTVTKSPPFEWELLLPNFPHDSLVRKSMPVRLEKVWLSTDQKSLLGSVAVANLAFQKRVVCRFTMDYWKTVSEVGTEYSHEIRPRENEVGHDRFTFTIKLSDTADLESKTLFFCVRYSVNGQEFWDNNNSTNFQVDFKKKHLPQNGKNGFQGAATKPINGLPRSNRRQIGGSSLRPLSVPASLDAFGHGPSVFKLDQPIHEYLGESDTPSGLRFKSKSSSSLASDNIANDAISPSGVAFSNRYDFGASLTAALKAAKDTSPTEVKEKEKEKDTLYMKRNVRGFESYPAVPFRASSLSESHSPTSSLPSASYEELVNKYCFFGSATKQSSPPVRDGSQTLKSGFRGEAKEVSPATGPHQPYIPVQTPSSSYHVGGATHHTLHLPHVNAYFPPMSSTQTSTTRTTSPQMSLEPMNLSLGRSTPPALASGSGTPTSDVVSERFPWTADAHTPTAIQG